MKTSDQLNSPDRTRRPRIAVSSGIARVPVTEGGLISHYVGQLYSEAIVRSGGVPMIVPPVASEYTADVARGVLGVADGLLLSGGGDIRPSVYSQNSGPATDTSELRDLLETALLDEADRLGMPVLGICRGMEMINVWQGGTLRHGVRHEHAETVTVDALGDLAVHEVTVEEGTLAHDVLGATVVEATCAHHQAPDRVGAGLTVAGRSADDSVEVVETSDRRVLGVIWHPELGWERAETHRRIYGWLIEEAGKYGRDERR